MSGGQSFEEKYKNRNFIHLLDNKIIREYINSYVNPKTKKACLFVLHTMFREFRKIEPDFEINNFFELNPVLARRKIWEVVQIYIQNEKYRTALNIKSYGSLIYEYANEEKGLTIKWSKKHRVPSIKIREGQTPTHSQVYKLVDVITHTDTKAIFLTSYSSGLKGEGLINLKIKHYKEAIAFREKLKEEFTNQLRRTEDPETIKELNYLINNLPLILRITYQIYPKRFTDNGAKSWYPAFLCRDAEEMINKYLQEDRPNSNDDDPLFVGRLSGKKSSQIQLSKWLKFNIKKFYKLTGELKDTAPSLVRRSFYNRLVSGNMKEIYSEYLQGHSLGVKKYYFDWDRQKKDIILQYLKCNFNRLNGDISKEITTLKEDSVSKDSKIKQLEEELRYFKSPEFTKNLVLEVNKFSEAVKVSPPAKTHKVKVKLDDGERLAKLMREGYAPTYSDNEIWILEKEMEE